MTPIELCDEGLKRDEAITRKLARMLLRAIEQRNCYMAGIKWAGIDQIALLIEQRTRDDKELALISEQE